MVATPGGDLALMIEPVLGSMGYELVDIEFGSGGLLRIVIDIAGGSRHVQVEDCEKVSHQLGRLFMVENVGYDRLEISSPGLDRPLKKAADFVRFAGQKVTLRMREAIEGRRQFTGVLQRDGRVGEAGQSESGATGQTGPGGLASRTGESSAKDRWVLYWSDEPVLVPGRKGGKGEKAGAKAGFKSAKSGFKGGKGGSKGGKGVAKTGVVAPGGEAAAAESATAGADDSGIEEQPRGQRLEFTLDQIEKARLVPRLVF